MEELLNRLEELIRKSLHQHDLKDQSIQNLRNGTTVLSHEKEQLIAKQHRAMTQIESLISKLKTLEKIS